MGVQAALLIITMHVGVSTWENELKDVLQASLNLLVPF